MGGDHIKSKKQTPDQVIATLTEGDQVRKRGNIIAEVVRSFCITETTWHRWKNTYGAVLANEAKQFKELKAENQKLKIIVADHALDIAILKELAFEKPPIPRPVVAQRF